MGYYIEGPTKGKAEYIIKTAGAQEVSVGAAQQALNDGKGVVCVVDNGPFEAAGFCFNRDEFGVFSDPGDRRRKRWLVMDRAQAAKLSGYREPVSP